MWRSPAAARNGAYRRRVASSDAHTVAARYGEQRRTRHDGGVRRRSGGAVKAGQMVRPPDRLASADRSTVCAGPSWFSDPSGNGRRRTARARASGWVVVGRIKTSTTGALGARHTRRGGRVLGSWTTGIPSRRQCGPEVKSASVPRAPLHAAVARCGRAAGRAAADAGSSNCSGNYRST